MTSVLLRQLFDPSATEVVGFPDLFPRRTAVMKQTYQQTLDSQSGGDMIVQLQPRLGVLSSEVPFNSFITVMEDRISEEDVVEYAVDVNEPPSTWLEATSIGYSGNADSTKAYMNYFRLVGFEAKFTYIGAPLYASGQAVVSFSNSNYRYGTSLGVAYTMSAWAMAHDEPFVACGPAQAIYCAHWIPQDVSETDLQNVRIFSLNPEQNDLSLGTFYFMATGLPPKAKCFRMDLTYVIEFVPPSNYLDLITLRIYPGDYLELLALLKREVLRNPKLVCDVSTLMGNVVTESARRELSTTTTRMQGSNLGYLP